ncbi:MAG: glycosyltransferase family 2 protein [Alphaproteobacteria bacterium]|nr:glycosyltransferase family 2 protein [Alphaproteobacteria bacterium]
MSHTVTVVIPVYNVEKYLEQCLDSVINQTYKDIEIICINDGSTDNSITILEKYALSDNRIKIISQTNQGISAARNAGIKVATGKYITFLDSDDFLSRDAIEKMVTAIENNYVDFVVCQAHAFAETEADYVRLEKM